MSAKVLETPESRSSCQDASFGGSLFSLCGGLTPTPPTSCGLMLSILRPFLPEFAGWCSKDKTTIHRILFSWRFVRPASLKASEICGISQCRSIEAGRHRSVVDPCPAEKKSTAHPVGVMKVPHKCVLTRPNRAIFEAPAMRSHFTPSAERVNTCCALRSAVGSWRECELVPDATR